MTEPRHTKQRDWWSMLQQLMLGLITFTGYIAKPAVFIRQIIG
jgi:hypothetical protein